MSQLSDWLKTFVQSTGRKSPTGEPLYSYRAKEQQFNELRALLNPCLCVALRLGSLSREMDADWGFAPGFVLYASEWWRRRYDGSGWAWDPIFASLGSSADQWRISERSSCVAKGLQFWKIEPRKTSGLRFLGSVAVQGGIPLNAVIQARTSISFVLQRLLRCAGESDDQLFATAEAHSTYLPKVYRQQEIYVLLAQMVSTVRQLKREAKLDRPDTALEQLNAFDRNWRDRFPLPIEADQAKGILDQLVRDAAQRPERTHLERLTAERRIEQKPSGELQLVTEVTVPTHANLAAMLRVPESATFPRTATLHVTAGSTDVSIPASRRIGNFKDFSLFPNGTVRSEGLDATAEQVVWSTILDKTYSVLAHRGESLNSELPWLFEIDTAGHSRFLKAGSGAVQSEAGIAVIPQNWTVDSTGATEVESIGTIHQLNRHAVQFRGILRVFDETRASFRLQSAKAGDDESLTWRGNRVWDVEFPASLLAFRGVPKLLRVRDDFEAPVVGKVVWKRSDQSAHSPEALGWTGPLQALWMTGSDVLFRDTVVVLPMSAHIALGQGAPNWGTIHFTDWALVSVNLDDPEVRAECKRDGNTFSVTLTYLGLNAPPETISLTLLFRDNPRHVTIQMPFPTRGARAFDKDGKTIPNRTFFRLGALAGVRMRSYPRAGERPLLRIGLVDQQVETDFHAQPVLADAQHPVRPHEKELADMISRMFSSAQTIDAYVSLELQCGEHYPAVLNVSRFDNSLERLDDEPAVTLGVPLSDMSIEPEIRPLMARLDTPGEEPVALMPRDFAIERMQSWDVPLGRLDPGPWLIYPPGDSPISYRPLLWTISGEAPRSLVNGLPSAVSEPDPMQRSEYLAAAIAEIARDYKHHDWLFVEQCARHFWHLPFNTLDTWQGFVRSPEAMASLALRPNSFPSGFLTRFSDELPVMWELIPIRTWEEAFRRREILDGVSHDSDLLSAFESADMFRLKSLHWLWVAAQYRVNGRGSKFVRAARSPFLTFADDLVKGADSALQHFLNDHGADENWPTSRELQRVVEWAYSNKHWRKYLCADIAEHRLVVVNIPIVLALTAAHDQTLCWTREERASRMLRRVQRFSPQWFSEAFDLTVARLIADAAIPGFEDC